MKGASLMGARRVIRRTNAALDVIFPSFMEGFDGKFQLSSGGEVPESRMGDSAAQWMDEPPYHRPATVMSKPISDSFDVASVS